MLWRTTVPGSFSHSLERVCWHQPMAFCKALGPSESSKPSGRVSRYTAGEPGRIPRQRFSAITTNLAGEVGIYAPVVAASFGALEVTADQESARICAPW